MENKILSYGYSFNDNEYKKLDWTIRFDNEKMEAFNSTFYHCSDIDKIDLDQLLIEIDEFIEESWL